MKLYDDLKKYIPKGEQEKVDLEAMLTFIERNDDCLLRDNLVAHFTSSAIVMNITLDKVLFAHHLIYNSWAWVGGHNDGMDDCLEVAIKEAKEETGLKNVEALTDEIAGIDIIYVMPHIKRGIHVSDHLHMNLTYILIADDQEELFIKADENTGVKWFGIQEVFKHVSEPRMKPIYQKMLDFTESYIKRSAHEKRNY